MEQNKNRVLDNDSLIEVWNNSTSSVSYITEKANRSWDVPGLSRKIRLDELQDVYSDIGGKVLFDESILLIKDNEARSRLGLDALDEYILDRNEMKQLLKSNELDQIEQFLQYSSNSLLDTFAQIAIELPLEDMNTARLIGKYTGLDILDIIKERYEDNKTVPVEPTKTTDSSGRAKRIAKE